MALKRAMRFACPSCGKNLKVPAEAVGKRVRCPGCQTPLLVARDEGGELRLQEREARADPPRRPAPEHRLEEEPVSARSAQAARMTMIWLLLAGLLSLLLVPASAFFVDGPLLGRRTAMENRIDLWDIEPYADEDPVEHRGEEYLAQDLRAKLARDVLLLHLAGAAIALGVIGLAFVALRHPLPASALAWCAFTIPIGLDMAFGPSMTRYESLARAGVFGLLSIAIASSLGAGKKKPRRSRRR